jgi:four helix bundle protein
MCDELKSNNFKTHKDLDVWKNAMEFAERTYLLTGKFPKEEQFGLTSQLRRSVVSIPSNIAEGAARNSDKEFLQFLYISLGSLAEAETQLLLATRLHFIDDASLLGNIETIRKMLLGLMKYLRGKTNA